MDGSYYFVVPKPSFWHLDAGGWEPSTASKADIVRVVKNTSAIDRVFSVNPCEPEMP